MPLAALFVLGFSMIGQAGAPADPLTADGLHAWLQAGGALEARDKLIHDQMQQNKASLPPWWPDDVYAQEEAAQQNVDFVTIALPFYQACMTDQQARLLAKFAVSKAGQQVSKAALQAHSQAALGGSSPTTAQTAGEHAADKTIASIDAEERKKVIASLTPAELKLAQQTFNPAKVAAFRQCTDKAYASTTEVMLAKQTAAVNAVIEADHDELVAAKTKWVKGRPDKTQ